MIYFLQPKDGGPIKIGSSDAPWKRASGIAAMFPYGVEPIVEIGGGRIGEKFLHLCFSPLATAQEWFASKPAMWRFLIDVLDNGKPSFIPDETRDGKEAICRRAIEAHGDLTSAKKALGYGPTCGGFEMFTGTSSAAYAIYSRMAFYDALRAGALPGYIAELHAPTQFAEAAE